MTIMLNGKTRDLPAGTTLPALLELLQMIPERVAVERNGGIVPKNRFAEVSLAEGDVLEIVHFVGGG